jgi:hypothetical protein
MAQTRSSTTILNIWADADGESHFRELSYEMLPMPLAGGTLSSALKVSNLWFRDASADQDSEWHVAPRRQFVVTLRGGDAEFTVSDGESRVLKPGEILLVEDTFGKGHKTRTLNGLARFGLYVSLAD